MQRAVFEEAALHQDHERFPYGLDDYEFDISRGSVFLLFFCEGNFHSSIFDISETVSEIKRKEKKVVGGPDEEEEE